MRHFIYFVKRRSIICITIFIVFSFLVYNYVYNRKFFYSAEAAIAFIGEKGSFAPEAEVESIRGKVFLKKVSEQISGISVSELEKGLILRFKKENILSVAFISVNPETARDTVNLICKAFLKERNNLIGNFNKKKRADLKEISDEVSELKYSLNISQRNLKELKAKNSESDIKAADLHKRLNELRLQKMELLKMFTEKHPDVVNISDKIESLEAEGKYIPDNSAVYTKLDAEIEEKTARLSSKEAEYKGSYSRYEAKAQPWHAKLAEEAYLPAKPMGMAKRDHYLLGFTGAFIVSLFLSVILELADKRIYTKIEAEERLGVPVIADIGRTMQVKRGIRKGSVIDHWVNSDSLRVYQQIFTYLNADVFKGDIDRKAIIITSAEKQTGKSHLACNLAFAAAKSGKKVLLIDSNLNHPSLADIFGLEKNAKGLSDILRGSLGHRGAVRNLTDLLLAGSIKLNKKGLSELDSMKILLSGTRVENPSGLLAAKELADLFKELTKSYGILIIDSSSIRGNPDTLNIIRMVDALLLMVNKSKTTYPALKDAISRIKNVNGPLTGLIFSHV